MTDQPRTRVFISYSRNDADFVDKLEVGLKSRGFDTWVDRRKLEAGTSWQRELQRAIENSQAMALVLSPDSLASPNVEAEYLHAFDRGLAVIPILYKTIDPAAFPMELKRLQWIDFRDQRQYDASLTNLVNALALLARPAPVSPAPAMPAVTPALSPESVTATPPEPASPPQQPSMPTSPLSLKDLYDRGDAAYRRGDLERAAIFFQQILLVNRDYLNGEVAKTMALLQKQIQTKRVEYLRADAAQAHDVGDWGREITDWQAVVQLEPNDRAAQEQLAHAKVNLDYVDAYAIVSDRLQRHELDLARQMLKSLWEKAPFYGDPEHLARKLGMTVPPTYGTTVRSQSRRSYTNNELHFGSPFTVWLYAVFFLTALGWGAGRVSDAIPRQMIPGTINALLVQSIAAAVAIGVVTCVCYMLGYKRSLNAFSMALAGLVAVVLAGSAISVTPAILAWSAHVSTYHFWFLGQLHITSSPAWGFAALFGVPYGAIGVLVGVFFVISSLDSGDAWIGCLLFFLTPLVFYGAGFIIGVLVGSLGWSISGAICGAICGAIFSVWYVAGLDSGTDNWGEWGLACLLGSLAILALSFWLFCWFPFSINSFGVVEWSIGAFSSALAIAGITAASRVLIAQQYSSTIKAPGLHSDRELVLETYFPGPTK